MHKAPHTVPFPPQALRSGGLFFQPAPYARGQGSSMRSSVTTMRGRRLLPLPFLTASQPQTSHGPDQEPLPRLPQATRRLPQGQVHVDLAQHSSREPQLLFLLKSQRHCPPPHHPSCLEGARKAQRGTEEAASAPSSLADPRHSPEAQGQGQGAEGRGQRKGPPQPASGALRREEGRASLSSGCQENLSFNHCRALLNPFVGGGAFLSGWGLQRVGAG